jgi:hypothetical protein
VSQLLHVTKAVKQVVARSLLNLTEDVCIVVSAYETLFLVLCQYMKATHCLSLMPHIWLYDSTND